MTEYKNRRILVIDDNPSIHDDFRKILGGNVSDTASLDEKEQLLFGQAPAAESSQGFEVDCAYQGEEGLAMIQQARQEGKPYTVAFVDIRMPPGWNGVETIEHIWNVDPDLQLVICSAYPDYTADELIERFGVSDRLLLLKKPCDCSEIMLAAVALNEKWNRAHQPAAAPAGGQAAAT